VNASKPVTRSNSEQVATDALLERQQELIRELHELLTTYGPVWYTAEIDARLSEALAMSTPARNRDASPRLITASKSLGTRMQELRTKRKSLWERFESNPNEIQLAAELRIIDDLIADCNERRNHRDDEMAQSSPRRGLRLCI